MGTKIDGLDIARSILDVERRVIIVEKTIDGLINSGKVSQQDVDKFTQEALKALQDKYPELGITSQPDK